MALSTGALTTVAKLLRYLNAGAESSDVLLPAFDVYNTESVGTAATVEVKDATMVLDVTGGVTTTITFAATATLTAVVAAINAIVAGNWVATLQGDGTVTSDWLATTPPTSAWGVESEITLSYAATDLLERVIEAASDQVEYWLDRKFVSQDFSEIGTFNRSSGLIQLGNPNVIGLDFFSLELQDALTVQYSGADDVATIEVRGDSLNVRSFTGVVASLNEDEMTFTHVDYDTIANLATEVTALAGWAGTTVTAGPSQYLDLRPVEDANGKAVTLESWVPFDDQYILHADEGYIEVGCAFANLTSGVPRYRVDYTAGFGTVPYDVEQVVIELASEMFKGAWLDTNLKSERLGDYAYQLAETTSGSSSRRSSWIDRLSAHKKMVI